MRPADLAELLKSLASDVREFVAHALSPLTAKQAELEARVRALPSPEKGEPGPPGPSAFEVARAAGYAGTEQEWLASLRGKDGESIKGDPGDPGTSVTVDDVLPLLREELTKALEQWPRPQDGRSVTVDDVRPLVRELVQAAVEALPPPAAGKDGTSVTLDDVRPLIERAVSEVPRPTAEDVRPIVRELVAEAVDAMPAPRNGEDGKSVTLDDVRPLVERAAADVPRPSIEDVRPVVRELVEAAVAAIPVPKDGRDGVDGKSLSLDDVRPLVVEAVAAIPGPSEEALHGLVRELVTAAVAAIPAPKDGRDGVDGKSVSLDDVRPLIEQAVAAIPKPKDGESVSIEVVAALVSGEVAKAVALLPRPQDGRDAAQIEPLPMIDPTRSYARGTWAKHAGGLWLARTTTEGMAGWDCIVNGVAALEMHTDGLRNIEVSALLSDGQRKAAEFTLPTMAYRGAWAAGEYQPGDTTSWDGSMWHCEETTTDRPGTSPAWRLCVKRGRDGKDGVRGPRGERGADGRAGRDLTQLGFNGQRT